MTSTSAPTLPSPRTSSPPPPPTPEQVVLLQAGPAAHGRPGRRGTTLVLNSGEARMSTGAGGVLQPVQGAAFPLRDERPR